jgi:hypothetical protein
MAMLLKTIQKPKNIEKTTCHIDFFIERSRQERVGATTGKTEVGDGWT